MTGLEDDNGKKIDKRNIIEAVVVLPSNLFYGTTIPGSIVFFNKNKPAHRKNKVLMVYAARDGWYKEQANMNTLLPHDILRIMTMLESWGDAAAAKKFIPTQEIRLHKKIQDDLDYKLSEIEIKYQDEIEYAKKKVLELKEKENPSKGQKNDLKKKEAALQKILDKKNSEIFDATAFAAKEKLGIENVKQELMQMFADPELRKRYFSIVDMDELEENEYNLNMPRYVDTYDPEEEIDLKEAIGEFNSVLQSEEDAENSLNEMFTLLKN